MEVGNPRSVWVKLDGRTHITSNPAPASAVAIIRAAWDVPLPNSPTRARPYAPERWMSCGSECMGGCVCTPPNLSTEGALADRLATRPLLGQPFVYLRGAETALDRLDHV